MLWIAGLFGVFLLGIPISFSLGATTLAGLLGMGLPLEVIVQRMFTGIDNFAFVAIPLFILAGNLMAVGGISKRITTFSEALVGHWPGGLGMVAIVASMIFAAVTGSAIAATAAIGVTNPCRNGQHATPIRRATGLAKHCSIPAVVSEEGTG